ncbi:hypothetical protein OG21DRAFT_1527012 [Imleria badia]|nr:hypothetical protein OG21DRAFT_1527012 [Imleria badia]
MHLPVEDELDFDQENNNQDNNIELDIPSLSEHMDISQQTVNYFVVAEALSHDCIPNASKPYHTFSSFTTVFHIANKSSLGMTVDEAAMLFGVPDLCPAIWEFLQHVQNNMNYDVLGDRTQNFNCPLALLFDHIQVWYKLHVQQFLYYIDERVDAPQTLRAFPPSPHQPHGLYDTVVISPGCGYIVVQLKLVFHPMNANSLTAYIQCFYIISQ